MFILLYLFSCLDSVVICSFVFSDLFVECLHVYVALVFAAGEEVHALAIIAISSYNSYLWL